MNTQLVVAAAAGGLLLATLASAQMGMGGGMGGMGRGMGGPGMRGHGPQGVSVLRHRYVMANGLDSNYATSHNPLTANDANLQAGKVLFEQNCATCHGASGHGNGPAAKGMTPAPADLTVALRMPIASDAYLDWTISEGGLPVQSAMPSFKASLARDELWNLVLYLRTL